MDEKKVRRRKKTGLVLVAVILTGGGIWLFYPVVRVEMLLSSYRQGEAHATLPELADFGSRGRGAAITALNDTTAGKPAGELRLALFHTLRVQRMKAAAEVAGTSYIVEIAYTDLPVDTKAVDVMVRAYAEEPSPEIREQFCSYISDLDFRFYFALYAGLARTSHKMPRFLSWPSSSPYKNKYQGDPVPRKKAWCDVIAPVARELLAGKVPNAENIEQMGVRVVSTLLSADCDDGGLAGIIHDFVRRLDADDRVFEGELQTRGIIEYMDVIIESNKRDIENGRAGGNTKTNLAIQLVDLLLEKSRMGGSSLSARYIDPLLELDSSCYLTWKISLFLQRAENRQIREWLGEKRLESWLSRRTQACPNWRWPQLP